MLENASFEGNLSIYTGDSWAFNPSLLIFLFLDEDTIPEGQAFTVTAAGGFQTGKPHIHCRWKDPATGDIETAMIMSDYRLDLRFDRMVGGVIPGRILFEIPGKDTRVEGRFNARIEGIDLTNVRTKETAPITPPLDTTISPTVVAPTPTGPSSVRVGGVRLVTQSDFSLGIMPLGQNQGYTLALIAELPAPAIEVSGGTVDKATTDTGKSLLPVHPWQRKIGFARLSKDKRTAVFDVELLLPDRDVGGLEELSGTLEYLTAGPSREVDLGTMDFKVGAKAGQFAAVIRSIEPNPWQDDETMLSLRLAQPSVRVDSAAFYAQDGTKLQTAQSGHESTGTATTLYFSIKGKLPQTGRIVLNVFEQLKRNVTPFHLTDISLTGQPR